MFKDIRAYHNSLHVIPAKAGIQGDPRINRGRRLGCGFRRSDEYTATGPIDAFDTGVLDFVSGKRRSVANLNLAPSC